MFGADFFRWIQFVIAAVRLFARIFGDEEDRQHEEEINNHQSQNVNDFIAKVTKPTQPKSNAAT